MTKIEWIKQKLETGETVYLSTCYRSIKLTKKHINLLSIGETTKRLHVKLGKKWTDVEGAKIHSEK